MKEVFEDIIQYIDKSSQTEKTSINSIELGEMSFIDFVVFIDKWVRTVHWKLNRIETTEVDRELLKRIRLF